MGDLYELLGVPRDSAAGEITKAYYKAARLCHPDKCPDDEDAKAKFQALGKGYSILKDTEKRKLYDETGCTDEDGPSMRADWREFYARVTRDEIERLHEEYKGSEEEVRDLKAAYHKHQGSMGKIMDEIMFCSFEDEDRFRACLEEQVRKGDLSSYPAFMSESTGHRAKRIRKAKKEAAEAAELATELGVDKKAPGNSSSMSLVEMIKSKQQRAFDDLTSSLEQKYAKPGKKKVSAAPPTDEEFERIQKKMAKKKGRR